MKARRRVAADRLAAAAAEGRGHQLKFMGGKERAYFAQASSTAAVSRSSRWAAGPAEPVPRKLANFRKTTALKLLRRSTVQQRRAAGQHPYAATAERTGGLFSYQVQPLCPVSGQVVKLFPLCLRRSPGIALEPGPGFEILPPVPLVQGVARADVLVLESHADLEQSADSTLASPQISMEAHPRNPMTMIGSLPFRTIRFSMESLLRYAGPCCHHHSRPGQGGHHGERVGNARSRT